MKCLILSDTHGQNEILKQMVMLYPDMDYYLHLGDSETTPDELEPFISVRGNNDFYDYPNELILEAEGHKMYLIHSSQYGYLIPGFPFSESRLIKLKDHAKEQGCDIVLYGHTHILAIEELDGVHMINPGSITQPRNGVTFSYVILELTKDTVTCTPYMI